MKSAMESLSFGFFLNVQQSPNVYSNFKTPFPFSAAVARTLINLAFRFVLVMVVPEPLTV